jgi:dolichyl-diphosphooligosaccharide--protein glycosyltransferase
MAVFLGFQVLMVLQSIRKTHLKDMTEAEFAKFQFMLCACCVMGAAVVGSMLMDAGKIWGLSVRIRSLFIKHTKTGNPLVDSVAEHQSTPRGFYMQYLHMVSYWAPMGVLMLIYDWCNDEAEEDKKTKKQGSAKKPTKQALAAQVPVIDSQRDAQIFVILFNLISIYFAGTMVRLILLVAPASACSGAVGFIRMSKWSYGILSLEMGDGGIAGPQSVTQAAAMQRKAREQAERRARREALDRRGGAGRAGPPPDDEDLPPFWEDEEFRMPRMFLAGFLMLTLVTGSHSFQWHCRRMAVSMSHPSIITKARDKETGEVVVYDDFREAYWWLRDNTPEDARVMAWWDYGYQINGVGNRTTVADGNTWNHEHIALLGRALTGTEETGHRIARHLADYVLVWTTRYAGMMGDDLAKSPHMARIASSVYKDIDASEYRMDHRTGEATPMMEASLLYRLHNYRLNPEAKVKLEHFEEAYTTTNQMVRIYKVLDISEESRAFFAENRCSNLHLPCAQNRRYPPGLQEIIEKGKAFSGAKLDGTAYNNREHHQLKKDAKISPPNPHATQENEGQKAQAQVASNEDEDEEDEFDDVQGSKPAVQQQQQQAGGDLPTPNEDDDEFES